MPTKKQKPPSETENGVRRPEKVVTLKQYLVVGSRNPEDPNEQRKAAFIMHTCAVNARKEFEGRFGLKIVQCTQTAESDLTKDDLPNHDFWTERRNWEMPPAAKREASASEKRYFEMKNRADAVRAAKAKIGIADWENVSEEQLKLLNQELSASERL